MPAGEPDPGLGPDSTTRSNPGRYQLACWVGRSRVQGDSAVQVMRMLDFVVYGTVSAAGMITVDGDIDVQLRGPGE